jgi:hypothetical protein
MLLRPWLSTSAGNLGPGLRAVGPLAPVHLVHDLRLVDHSHVHGHAKHRIAQLGGVYDLTFYILDRKLHNYYNPSVNT